MGSREALVQATISGDRDAWQALQVELCAAIEEIARRHASLRARKLHAAADDISEVRVATFERLARDDFRNLRRYQEQRDKRGANAQSLDSWVYGAVDYTIREHLRRRYGRVELGASAAELPDLAAGPHLSKRAVNTFADRLDAGDHAHLLAQTLGLTTKLTAAAILSYVDRTFSETEARALRMYYLEEQELGAIAEQLGLPDPQQADKLIRRLNARLRYAFGDGGGADAG